VSQDCKYHPPVGARFDTVMGVLNQLCDLDRRWNDDIPAYYQQGLTFRMDPKIPEMVVIESDPVSLYDDQCLYMHWHWQADSSDPVGPVLGALARPFYIGLFYEACLFLGGKVIATDANDKVILQQPTRRGLRAGSNPSWGRLQQAISDLTPMDDNHVKQHIGVASYPETSVR